MRSPVLASSAFLVLLAILFVGCEDVNRAAPYTYVDIPGPAVPPAQSNVNIDNPTLEVHDNNEVSVYWFP